MLVYLPCAKYLLSSFLEFDLLVCNYERVCENAFQQQKILNFIKLLLFVFGNKMHAGHFLRESIKNRVKM